MYIYKSFVFFSESDDELAAPVLTEAPPVVNNKHLAEPINLGLEVGVARHAFKLIF